MARAKSERARSKTSAIDDLTQSIEQLQAFLPTVEDLGREGFPYLEGAKARTELQLRECIKRAFGDKSQEFQAHRHHKFTEPKQTAALIRSLVAALEDRKLELQGLKPVTPEPPEPSAEPARPTMALVPPSAPPTSSAPAPSVTSSMTSSPPVFLHVTRTTTTEQSAAVPAASTSPTAPAPAVEVSADSPSQSILPRVPIEPISSLFRTQETKPMPIVPAPSAAVPPPLPSPPARPPSEPVRYSTTQEVAPSQPSRPSTASSPSPSVSASNPTPPEADHLPIAKNICQRFHFVARQLRLRGEYRSSVSVEDESDVQDLLHALLRVQFDDIGTDEWTPEYTNGASRTTFLLNHDRLAVVAKKTRAGLTMTDLKDQVRTDIERYRARGRCTSLLCFIYDPDGRIGNPRGIESELTSTSEQFSVDIVVAPK
jgi:hypothetical protein